MTAVRPSRLINAPPLHPWFHQAYFTVCNGISWLREHTSEAALNALAIIGVGIAGIWFLRDALRGYGQTISTLISDHPHLCLGAVVLLSTLLAVASSQYFQRQVLRGPWTTLPTSKLSENILIWGGGLVTGVASSAIALLAISAIEVPVDEFFWKLEWRAVAGVSAGAAIISSCLGIGVSMRLPRPTRLHSRMSAIPKIDPLLLGSIDYGPIANIAEWQHRHVVASKIMPYWVALSFVLIFFIATVDFNILGEYSVFTTTFIWIIAWSRAIAILPAVARLTSTLPIMPSAIARSAWRYPALLAFIYVLILVPLLSLDGAPPEMIVAIVLGILMLASLSFVLAWRFRLVPYRTQIAASVALLLSVPAYQVFPPLGVFALIGSILWHIYQAKAGK